MAAETPRVATVTPKRVPRKIYIKDPQTEEHEYYGTVFLKKMSEADSEQRMEYLTEKKAAEKKGASQGEINFHVERIRFADFDSCVIQLVDVYGYKLNEMGEPIYTTEPKYFKNPDGTFILDRDGEKMVEEDGEAELEPLSISGSERQRRVVYRRLWQPVAERIQKFIKDLNDIPDDDEYDELVGRSSTSGSDDDKDDEEREKRVDPTSGGSGSGPTPGSQP